MKRPAGYTSALLALLLLFLPSACSDDPGATGGPTVLTIATYNVEDFTKGVDIPGGSYYAAIAAIVATNEVGVLCLNEVQDNDGDEANFTAALNAAGWPMPYHGFTSMSDGYNANGYCSRFPVSSVSEILPPYTYNTRTIQRYKVTMPSGAVIWFYGCHLKSLTNATAQEKRESESLNLANYIRSNHNPDTDYIVILGDMNTMNTEDWANATTINGNATVNYLELKDDADPSNNFISLTRTDIYPDTTAWNYPSGLPLDHIILSPALYGKYVPGSIKKVGSGTAGSNPSDHYMVKLQVEL